MADFGFNAGMQNPFTAGLLAMVAAQDPGTVASAASSVGIPPPDANAAGGGDPLSALAPFMTPSADPSTMAAAPGGAGFGAMPGAAGAQANPLAMLQALKGFQGPKPVAPIMNAGVSGSQKAPDQNNAGINAGSSALLQLIQGLTQHNQQAQVGTLGKYIGV